MARSLLSTPIYLAIYLAAGGLAAVGSRAMLGRLLPAGLLLAGLLLVAVSDRAVAKKPAPVPCPAGLFGIENTPPFAGAALVTLDAGAITFDAGCSDPAPATIKPARKRTRLSARWPSCTDLPRGAKLEGAIAAPACDTITGVVVTRKAKPKRRKLRATRLGPTDLVASLDDVDTQRRMLDENSPTLIRAVAEAYNPELRQLIAMGPGAVDSLLAPFRQRVTLAHDIPLSLYAFALERIGDPRAVPALADWLDVNLFASTIFATDFVTHTIKVLGGFGGLQDDFLYDIDEKLDTIAQAKAGTTATAAAANAIAPRATIPESKNRCEATLLVTGIGADGRQTTARLNYTLLFYDLQEQIDLEADATQKAVLARMLANLRANDEANYGGTDYRAIGDVSVKSNCGGTVTENVMNAVAERRGFPLRLGSGGAAADDIRDLARTFGNEIGVGALDTFSVIAHERPTSGKSVHVEVPVGVSGGFVTVFSKDNQGAPRLHTVDTGNLSTLSQVWTPIQQLYNFRPFAVGTNFEATAPKFYRVDPDRILDIRLDTSACPCEFAYGGAIPVAITEPTAATTSERVITVAGTVGSPDVTSGNLRLNGSAQAVVVAGGTFTTKAVLSSGDNRIRVAVDGPDGGRGCAETTIRSETERTTISATLTWDASDADLDLYVTQPDGETAWYGRKTTSVGGRLDVDNTSGIGPENYFLGFDPGAPMLTGTYAIRVHYYSDHRAAEDTPPRAVRWRVTLLLNEGTPNEKRQFFDGVLGVPSPGNAAPGSAGPDWADVAQPAL
ncbi:MAG: DUF2135 domain-containing protein [bacterium]|nr:DUF2135 domain-containing protein [bacterium]